MYRNYYRTYTIRQWISSKDRITCEGSINLLSSRIPKKSWWTVSFVPPQVIPRTVVFAEEWLGRTPVRAFALTVWWSASNFNIEKSFRMRAGPFSTTLASVVRLPAPKKWLQLFCAHQIQSLTPMESAEPQIVATRYEQQPQRPAAAADIPSATAEIGSDMG